jgi:O-antigen ligase
VAGQSQYGNGASSSSNMGLFWLVLGCAVAFLGSMRLAMSGGGLAAVAAIFVVIGGVMVIRRPVLGIAIYLTTFLFTYPEFLRGSGNFTINNMLGLALLPLMLFGIMRDGSWWITRYRPVVILGVIVALMIGSSIFYSPGVDVGRDIAAERALTSSRSQGPALISTRDAGTKFFTRYVFLIFFVFFVRTPRDLKIVAGTIIACLLLTYLSVSAEAGPLGWGTGRLRVQGEAGFGIYAGRNPNKLAYFALLGLTLLWYGRRAIRSPFMYPFWALATAITFIMIPLTGSRSGLLNLLLFISIVLLEGKFNYRKVIGLAFVAIFVIVQIGYDLSVVDLFFPEDIANRLTRFDVRTEALEMGLEAQGSAEGRIQTAQSALRVFSYHPLVGVGIGNFNFERAILDPFGTMGPPHNSYLWALAEGGILTFGLFLAFFAYLWRAIRDIEWEYEARFGDLRLGWLVSAMRTMLIGFMFYSFFADMWHHVMFYIVMGLMISTIRVHQVYAETGQVPKAFTLGRTFKRPDPDAPI